MPARTLLASILWLSMSLMGCIEAAASMLPRAAERYPQEQATVQYDSESDEYVFTNMAVEPPVMYRLNMRDGNLLRGLLSISVRVEERFLLIPVYQGGFYLRNAEGAVLEPAQWASPQTSTLLRHQLENGRVIFDYEDVVGEETLNKRYVFYLRGNTLVVEMSDLTPEPTSAVYVGFSFEPSRYLRNGKLIDLPGTPFPVVQCMEDMFLSTYLDPFYSNAVRYTITRNERDIRAIHASNTPAWTQLDQGRLLNPLRLTAYLTVSHDIMDVLPAEPAPPSQDPLVPVTFLLELGEWPLSHPEATPYAMVRRWQAPHNGTVTLQGDFSLASGDLAICEVILIENQAPQPRTLFSQVLDPAQKPATAIEGTFPVQQGDQLLFVHKGPSVMQGGELEWSVRIDMSRERFESRADFSSAQGEQGWYYEEQRGAGRMPLVWNADRNRWESLSTGGYQTASRLVCRSGAKENAYPFAAEFVNELLQLGLSGADLILRDWLSRAAPASGAEGAWGDLDSLDDMIESLRDNGNRVFHNVGPDEVIQAAAEAYLLTQVGLFGQSEGPSDASPMDQAFESLAKQVSRAMEAPGDGAVLISPPLSLLSRLGFQTNQIRFAEQGSQYTLRRLEEWMQSLQRTGKRLYTQFEGEGASPYAALAERMSDGVLASVASNGGVSMLVDHAVRSQRPSLRIGVGDYSVHDFSEHSRGPVDPRFFPMNDYMSTTVMFRRAPHISDRFWHPTMKLADVRNLFVQAISLLHPVAQEYLAPGVQPVEIRYYTDDDNGYSINRLLAENKVDEAKRLLILYNNGLHVFVNRSDEPWNPPGSGLTMERIDSGGFLAVNAQTGLLSLIGERYQRRFTVGIGRDSYFLQSKDRKLFEFGDYATDGLCRLARSAWDDRWNIITVDAMEIMDASDMTPLIRCNRRFSARHWWTSPQRLELSIVDIERDDTLLEIYTLPQSVFRSEEPAIEVMRVRAGRETPEAVEWRSMRVGQKQGIRIGAVRPGDRYTIVTHSVPSLEEA